MRSSRSGNDIIEPSSDDDNDNEPSAPAAADIDVATSTVKQLKPCRLCSDNWIDPKIKWCRPNHFSCGSHIFHAVLSRLSAHFVVSVLIEPCMNIYIDNQTTMPMPCPICQSYFTRSISCSPVVFLSYTCL